MNGQKADPKVSRRGVIGVEAAIIMTAFLVTASAVSFVIIGMGFNATQDMKTAIASGMDSATGSIVSVGDIKAKGIVTANRLSYVMIPVQVSAGGGSVNLETSSVGISYFSNKAALEDIYKGILTNSTYSNSTLALAAAVEEGYINAVPDAETGLNATSAIVYFSSGNNGNPILDYGETAIIMVIFREDERPASNDMITAQIDLATGSTLIINRVVPSISETMVSMH